jgi:hypothetical protein
MAPANTGMGYVLKAAPSRTSKRLKNYGTYIVRLFSFVWC